MKYDIFISYRRDGGSEFARSVKSALESRGYSVFLDFDELKDGVFDERILSAIEQAPVFMFILSEYSLDRCVNEDDWVRREIEYAYGLGKHFIPVNKDGDFTSLPVGMPQTIAEVFGRNQYSEIMIGQLFEASMDKMIKERIVPFVKRPARRIIPRILGYLIIVAVVVAAGLLATGRSKAFAAIDRYETILVHADSLALIDDSVNVAMKYVIEAESVALQYADTKYADRFSNHAEESRDKIEKTLDAIFVRNRNFADFYMDKYREDGDIADKKRALEYLDKALEVKYDDELAAMRRILQ
ncbi:MAG: toll/interleukin-1 receptor domain-containing protein [Bacteroidales bacterium]|nr:toll/interleukin-1 receptor domain-containing protein [Bacteroidales bacterium]